MNTDHTLFHILESLRMSDEERTRIREELLVYTDEHRIIQSEPAPYLPLGLLNGRFTLYASLMAVLVVSSGAVSLASETSIPGSPLYSIKVNVREPVATALAFSDSAKAKVASKIAVQRLDEITVLAASGNLTEERQMALEDSFEKHVEKLAIATEKLEKEGDAESARAIHEEFTLSLAVEAQALSAVGARDKERTKRILGRVMALALVPEEDSEEEAPPLTVAAEDPTIPPILLSAVATSSATSTVSGKKAPVKVYRPRALFITASTTLGGLGGVRTIAPRQDSALPRELEDESYSTDSLQVED